MYLLLLQGAFQYWANLRNHFGHHDKAHKLYNIWNSMTGFTDRFLVQAVTTVYDDTTVGIAIGDIRLQEGATWYTMNRLKCTLHKNQDTRLFAMNPICSSYLAAACFTTKPSRYCHYRIRQGCARQIL